MAAESTGGTPERPDMHWSLGGHGAYRTVARREAICCVA